MGACWSGSQDEEAFLDTARSPSILRHQRRIAILLELQPKASATPQLMIPARGQATSLMETPRGRATSEFAPSQRLSQRLSGGLNSAGKLVILNSPTRASLGRLSPKRASLGRLFPSKTAASPSVIKFAPSNRSRRSSKMVEKLELELHEVAASDKEVAAFLRYRYVKLLGRGNSGAAHLMRSDKGEDSVVCKVAMMELKGQRSNESSIESVQSEVRILASLSHPHVVGYRGSLRFNSQLLIFMEYADGGTLEEKIRRHAVKKVAFKTVRVTCWVSQLSDALQHLHTRRVLHRDLKSANVFLTAADDVKLGDFGVARSLSTNTKLANTVVGTPYYMAPELISDAPYAEPADLWSLGVIMYELITLDKPFKGDNLGALILRISSGSYDRAPLENCTHPSWMIRLASDRALLQTEPSLRMTLDVLRGRILDMAYRRTPTERQSHGERGTPLDMTATLTWLTALPHAAGYHTAPDNTASYCTAPQPPYHTIPYQP